MGRKCCTESEEQRLAHCHVKGTISSQVSGGHGHVLIVPQYFHILSVNFYFMKLFLCGMPLLLTWENLPRMYLWGKQKINRKEH